MEQVLEENAQIKDENKKIKAERDAYKDKIINSSRPGYIK
jgi:hypothetical protein